MGEGTREILRAGVQHFSALKSGRYIQFINKTQQFDNFTVRYATNTGVNAEGT